MWEGLIKAIKTHAREVRSLVKTLQKQEATAMKQEDEKHNESLANETKKKNDKAVEIAKQYGHYQEAMLLEEQYKLEEDYKIETEAIRQVYIKGVKAIGQFYEMKIAMIQRARD